MTGVTLMQNVYNRTKKPNQSPAAGGFDSGRRSSGVSARWLLMQRIKSRRKRYEACDDVAWSTNFEYITKNDSKPNEAGLSRNGKTISLVDLTLLAAADDFTVLS